MDIYFKVEATHAFRMQQLFCSISIKWILYYFQKHACNRGAQKWFQGVTKLSWMLTIRLCIRWLNRETFIDSLNQIGCFLSCKVRDCCFISVPGPKSFRRWPRVGMGKNRAVTQECLKVMALMLTIQERDCLKNDSRDRRTRQVKTVSVALVP